MEKFTRHIGLVAPLDRANVDTDAIIPKQFLRSIRRTGFGENLFDEWRFHDRTEPGMPAHERIVNREFVLNQPRYEGASILLCRENFGCGSSREHAPWALQQYGFKVLLAPSFADIFFSNCYKNGLLPVVLPEEKIEILFRQTFAHEDFRLDIDLLSQRVITPDGASNPFDITESRKSCLVNGLDDVGLTLQHSDEIARHEAQRHASAPWLEHSLADAPRYREA